MLKYRPEIDGLRTIAVLSVMVYHLKIPTSTSTLLSGGFLGVDLFFVISGFLITSIIQTEINRTGTFSFLKFYNRRARRILPPLIFVMLASIPFGWFILDPEPLVHYGFSLVSALAFISNFFWYFALGTYGGPTGLVEPFLHTWSLSIEEQFYLLFPVILLLSYYIRKKVSLIAILLLMIAISFLIAVATTHIDKDFSFYVLRGQHFHL